MSGIFAQSQNVVSLPDERTADATRRGNVGVEQDPHAVSCRNG